MKIDLEIENNLAIAIAVQRGWTPLIEDEAQPMVGDEFPTITNPESPAQFLSRTIPLFVEEYVKREGRKLIVREFQGIFDAISHQVSSGHFDDKIILGDREGIKTSVRESLNG